MRCTAFSALLLLSGLTSAYSLSAFTTKTPAPLSPEPTPVQIEKQRSCFSGPAVSHQSFLDWLNAQPAKPGVDPQQRRAMLEQQFKAQDFARYQANVDCNEIRYTVDGHSVRGYILSPKSADKKLPVLIFNRGGNGDFGQLVFGQVYQQLMPVAEQGFVILASNYRSDQLKLGATLLHDEFGGAEVADVLALKAIADQLPQADSSQLAIWGHSRGGMMTYLAATQWPGPVKALVVGAGVADLESHLQFRPAMEKVYQQRMPGYADNKTALLRARSALYFLDDLPKVPLLLQHGEQDERVEVAQSKLMAGELEKRQWPYQLMLYPAANHSFAPVQQQVRTDMVQWLKQQLK
ncbi:alpha/beta hydrolase family protein [Rheinheimera marina]|uniref:Alpha/beta hydrolase family protein n=1 Tax=Rheinheimera marina TaxID=1774958 RepID=A0ABV9JL10_9GAMM